MDLPSTQFFSHPRPTPHPASSAPDASPPHPHPPMDLPSTHFLSQPRPTHHTQASTIPLTGTLNIAPNIVDTTTLAAHDFDVDTQTGFMPRTPPLARLPQEWEVWEGLFDWARFGLAEGERRPLQLGEKKGLTDEEKRRSEVWRDRVRTSPILDPTPLESSEPHLRRAHLVLAWLMHFYIHILPPDEEVIIPKSISVPLLVVSWALQIPPVLTYSDDVLYNWHFAPSSTSSSNGIGNTLPTPETIVISTTFTSTPSESHFYLTSARIELVGVKALDLMSASLDEAFVSDSIAYRRIASYLREMKGVIGELEDVLVRVKEGCDPVVFYEEIRPWFRGEDSSRGNGKWKFEALDHPLLLARSIPHPTELSGASAGQSTLIHALDIFLGVPTNEGFQQRMKRYMPRYHRRFLEHLEGRGGSVRGLVERAQARVDSMTKSEFEKSELESESGSMTTFMDEGEEMDLEVARELVEAYNEAVGALKRFRDAHLRIVALYIVGPARRGGLDRRIKEAREKATSEAHDNKEKGEREEEGRKEKERKELKGTGGTDLVKFLKTVRDRTGETVLR